MISSLLERDSKVLVAVGRVTQSAFYSPGKNPHVGYPNVLGVSWQGAPRDKAFPSSVFLRQTLVETSEEKFRKLIEGETPLPGPSEGIEDPQAFVLEKYLGFYRSKLRQDF